MSSEEAPIANQEDMESEQELATEQSEAKDVKIEDLDAIDKARSIFHKLEVQYLEAKVKLRELTDGRRHPDTLEAMLDLSLAYRGNQQFEEAESVLQNVAKVRREDLGENHRDTLACMIRISEVKCALGHDAESIKMQQDILETRKRVLGEYDDDTINNMEQLAILHYNRGEHFRDEKDMEKSVEYYRMAVAAYTGVLGSEHEDTQGSVEQLESAEKVLAEIKGKNKHAS